MRTRALVIQKPARSPAAPPAAASNRLSVRNCRTICDRLAPSAPRIATSSCRAAARAIIRFATLVHAISSTTPTSHCNTISGLRKSAAGRIARAPLALS